MIRAKSASAKAKRHMQKVAGAPCVLCSHLGLANDSPSVVHHMKLGTGASDRASDFLTIALCPHHHDNSQNSVHQLKEKGLRLRYNLSEIDLLAMTLEAIA
jgi:hypothetical protein